MTDIPRIATPILEHIARVVVQLQPAVSLGQSPWGERRLVPIIGGHFDGPRMRGVIVPGGADWQVVHGNGMISIDTRYALRTHDHALIYIATRGVRSGSPDVLARLGRGEPVDPTEYYFRVVATFETGAPAYYWLNEGVFVASAVRQVDAVVYDLYRVS
jgi:Protein of unknown function (DUF3237)